MDSESPTSAQHSLLTTMLQHLPDSFAQLLALGGTVTLILIAMSMVALTIVIVKSIQMYAERSRNSSAIDRALLLWRQDDRTGAIASISHAQSGVGRLLKVAMQGCESPGVSEAHVKEEIQRLASGDMENYRSHLRSLEFIGTVSPLLGLFGTVLGMIEAFRQMEQAGSQVDPSVLSGGIWQALLTTGVGLAVAIPTMLAHQWLDRRAERHAHRIEDTVTRVFTAHVQQGNKANTDDLSLTTRRSHAAG
ncbi:MotA/TolQ/ExbB proton channel family protein [Granulosicoccus antarcticus]|uniref:Biopolymer transport protein ExbB n=1 Tax=Granulosicoccus antarcticus IMCC3135 TaxID=1192854 RepID=A0A2Z2NUF5_9GAMM|nr:MotA/TolQ/ExbB proton channel family protein [Granulosicoccus antarcticus]ASJ75202.1 Biopolymer transport protein ExbB [Granulosicoccus antarcticus IMCC3135]